MTSRPTVTDVVIPRHGTAHARHRGHKRERYQFDVG
jgi:hypothetical protein